MKIAVVSQRYHWESYSVVRSLVENIGTEKDIVKWYDTEFIYDSFEPAIVFYIGANATGFSHRVPKIGIGVSDPNLFSLERAKKFDIYFTSAYRISKQYDFPWLPCFSDFKYFHKMPYEKIYDVTFIGGCKHPISKDRYEITEKLREHGIDIHCFGDGWPVHPFNHKFISGNELIKVINQSMVILDITSADAPISSRIFQAAACGVSVVTFYKEELRKLFDNISMNYYLTYKDMLELLKMPNTYHDLIGIKALFDYNNKNDITHRVKKIWKVIHDKNIL